ncbi:pyrroline-5-carboxylate reductase-like [Teleopsis dalmanni]|uniref:pyrroline-5-carboxylate reductase-like n=1 Tax=Teleopsis dalmanni TaxID=139649 RepID=UPI0018CCA04C|nr:pyrroline-5-carboxylate reductase-like [Teleopsis dalmanni]
MGGALLAGWLRQGLNPQAVQVITPRPTQALADLGVRVGGPVTDAAVAVLAVKPQKMTEALPRLASLGGGNTLFISVAAGIRIAAYEAALGAGTPVVRAMPNTPAAIGQGITPIIGNASATETDLRTAEGLLQAVGQVVRLDAEDQMDAVTAVSGSGPAYVFHLIETLAAAGEAEGLSRDLALTLARATVAGAGALAVQSGEDPAQLRINVTSPGGTTAAALQVLMQPDAGFPQLLKQAVHAAAQRGRELGK